eukprot:TRINITY_DN1286_c0_g1_i1.p1 TRINITY_DN1286_c0_g1~~TRINITY_DN1286_c0_g1_i1.p1  ORF type:complete len:101 (+),score=24.82 TRINITY_DN1286_c0_g1_i1:548-850(+)
MEWVDEPEQGLVGLDEGVRFIHEHRLQGHNVVVNCAQGKSRSSSMVIAYLLTTEINTLEEALRFTQERRAIAQPNRGFMEELKNYESSETRAQLKEELNI